MAEDSFPHPQAGQTGVVGIVAPNLHPLLAGEAQGYGGAELDMRHITEALAQRGWRPVLLTQTESPTPLTIWQGIEVRTVRPRPAGQRRSRNRVIALLGDLRYILRFAFALWRMPGTIWITKLAGLQSLLAMIVGRWRRIPVVFRFGHDGETDPDHLVRVCFAGQARLARAFIRRLPGCAAILAQTMQQADLLKRRMGLEARVIPNAHPVRTIAPLPAAERNAVLWVGRGDPIKRPLLMLDAAERLPGVSIRMVMPPSGGHGDLSESVRQRAGTLPDLTLLEGMPHGKVQAEFAQARVFILTSAGEGLPNVLLEALKHGTPVISLVVNPDGLLNPGEPTPGGTPAPGWCIGEDPAALVQAIRTLLDDPDLLAASGAAARSLALENFDLEAVGRQYQDLMNELANDPNRRSGD